MFYRSLKIIFVAAFLLLAESAAVWAASGKIRAGYFPNVTHVPALVARATKHFESRLGDDVAIEWKIFSAGPEAIEALFAGAIDILYVGPNPAVNGFIRSDGDALHIIAGVSSDGSGFVVRENSGIERFEDLHGKRVASPQRGNSQDVALHYRLKERGMKPTTEGGDVEIFHITGGDQITAFLKEQVDAIWTVEPWITRLVVEAKGRLLFEESELWPDGKYATTVLVVRKEFMEQNRDLVQQWVSAHAEIIEWINSHYPKAKQIFNEEFERETGKSLPADYLDRFFARIAFTEDPMTSQVLESGRRAAAIGYLGRKEPDFSDLYELSFLEAARDLEKKA